MPICPLAIFPFVSVFYLLLLMVTHAFNFVTNDYLSFWFYITCIVLLFFFLHSRITPEYAPLLAELCDEQVYTLIRPAEVKQRKKVRKLTCEITDLKNRLAQAKLSKNIVLSNREIRLLR